MTRHLPLRLLALLLPLLLGAAAPSKPGYPTDARVEYVLQCLEGMGDGPYAVARCSCRIDQIALGMDYAGYRTVQTVLALQGASGQRAAAMRDVPELKDLLQRFRAIEVDAEFACP